MACERCETLVLRELTWKTQGLCVPCFQADLNETLSRFERRAPGGGTAKILRSQKSRNKRLGRSQQKKRWKSKPEVREQRAKVKLADARAKARLARLFPDLFAMVVADERAKLGLQAWSVERLVAPPQREGSPLDVLDSYYGPDAGP